MFNLKAVKTTLTTTDKSRSKKASDETPSARTYEIPSTVPIAWAAILRNETMLVSVPRPQDLTQTTNQEKENGGKNNHGEEDAPAGELLQETIRGLLNKAPSVGWDTYHHHPKHHASSSSSSSEGKSSVGTTTTSLLSRIVAPTSGSNPYRGLRFHVVCPNSSARQEDLTTTTSTSSDTDHGSPEMDGNEMEESLEEYHEEELLVWVYLVVYRQGASQQGSASCTRKQAQIFLENLVAETSMCRTADELWLQGEGMSCQDSFGPTLRKTLLQHHQGSSNSADNKLALSQAIVAANRELMNRRIVNRKLWEQKKRALEQETLRRMNELNKQLDLQQKKSSPGVSSPKKLVKVLFRSGSSNAEAAVVTNGTPGETPSGGRTKSTDKECDTPKRTNGQQKSGGDSKAPPAPPSPPDLTSNRQPWFPSRKEEEEEDTMSVHTVGSDDAPSPHAVDLHHELDDLLHERWVPAKLRKKREQALSRPLSQKQSWWTRTCFVVSTILTFALLMIHLAVLLLTVVGSDQVAMEWIELLVWPNKNVGNAAAFRWEDWNQWTSLNDLFSAPLNTKTAAALAESWMVQQVAWSTFCSPAMVAAFAAMNRSDALRLAVLVHGMAATHVYLKRETLFSSVAQPLVVAHLGLAAVAVLGWITTSRGKPVKSG